MEDLDVNVSAAESAWRGRRVLVTGHTGFKGSWLSLLLHRLGAEVTGYALSPPTQPSLFGLARLHELVDHHEGDIRDADRLGRMLEERRPEVVFHLASQALVFEARDKPLETFSTNVIGTAGLLEAVRRCDSVRALVVVTSDKCYENREWQWPYREVDPLGGRDPYSASKACQELVTACWRSTFLGAIGLATARAGNVVGGGDWASNRLVPDWVRAVVEARPLEVRCPEAIRPWQHVLDPLRGYLLLAEHLLRAPGEFSTAWNFGPGGETLPVGDLVDSLCRRWGEGASWRAVPSDVSLEAGRLQLDSSRARAQLGWRPIWPIDRVVEEIVDWARRWQAGEDVRQVTLDQIDRFLEEMG